MKKHQKIIVFLLATALIASFITISAAASTEPTITVSTVEGAVGETVDVDIALLNNPGIVCMQLKVDYNSDVLELVAVNDTGLLPGQLHTPTLKSPYYLTWMNDRAEEDFTVNGTIVTLQFKIKDANSVGDINAVTVSYDYNNYDIFNVKTEPIKFAVQNGSINVVCAHKNTVDVAEKPADCVNSGYTAGVWCNDCKTYISGHKEIPATGNHTDEDGKWESNEENHFHTCACGHVFDTAAHSGGSATCTEKAKCEVCGAEYGQVNSENHTGGTTIVNAKEPNHKTQQSGYTGDTKCLGCGEIIAYGKVIEPGTHTPADVWSTDETHHWKECNVVGCGIVIDGTKAEHVSTGDNVATCQKRAVCDVCGVSYGEVASHDYTAQDKKQDALKSEGSCCDHAVYWYSCSVCGGVEHNDAHTFNGDKNTEIHVGGTTLVNASDADHKTQQSGYTGDTKCLGCGEIITYGKVIEPGTHTPADVWSTDETHHWKECNVVGCGIVIDGTKAEHVSTGDNVATCQKQAVCDVCGVSYGTVADHDHSHTLSKDETGHWYACQTEGCEDKHAFAEHTPDREAPTETEAVKCSVCGYVITPALGHTHAYGTEWKADEDNHWHECGCTDKIDVAKHLDENSDGKCDVCGHTVPQPTPDNPQSGDHSMVYQWIALLCVSGACMAVMTVYGKKRMF